MHSLPSLIPYSSSPIPHPPLIVPTVFLKWNTIPALVIPLHSTHSLLRLNTPNINTTDLVVFLFFLYLIRLTYDSHAVSLCFPFHFTSMPHAPLTSFISMQVHGYVFPFFSSILPPPCGCLMFYLLSISWPCSMHASTSCY